MRVAEDEQSPLEPERQEPERAWWHVADVRTSVEVGNGKSAKVREVRKVCNTVLNRASLHIPKVESEILKQCDVSPVNSIKMAPLFQYKKTVLDHCIVSSLSNY